MTFGGFGDREVFPSLDGCLHVRWGEREMTDPDQPRETLEGVAPTFVGRGGLAAVAVAAQINQHGRDARHGLAGAPLEEQAGDGDRGPEWNVDRIFASFANDKGSRKIGQDGKIAGRLQLELEPADGDRGEGESPFVVGRRLHVAGRLGLGVRSLLQPGSRPARSSPGRAWGLRPRAVLSRLRPAGARSPPACRVSGRSIAPGCRTRANGYRRT